MKILQLTDMPYTQKYLIYTKLNACNILSKVNNVFHTLQNIPATKFFLQCIILRYVECQTFLAALSSLIFLSFFGLDL